MKKKLTKMLSVLTAVVCFFVVSTFNSFTANAADQLIKGIIDDYVYEIWNAFYKGDVEYEYRLAG